jgi:hypothetical protein
LGLELVPIQVLYEIVQSLKYLMMQRPPLSDNQFAVSMADGATGHVLTIDGEIFLNDGKETFIVFDTMEAARLFIEGKQSENDTLEFYIYNSNYEFMGFWEAKKWKR